MAQGLPVTQLITATINLAPLAAQTIGFDTLLVMGNSDVIDVSQRIRSYGTLAAVAGDFGTAVPEYLAAQVFFSQTPQPSQLFIGRWAASPSHGILQGGDLTPADETLSNWTSITDGSMDIQVDGFLKQLRNLNFSGATNLNGVASVITAALSGSATCLFGGDSFNVESASVGLASTVSYAVTAAPPTGTDVSGMLALTSDFASAPVAGIAAETAVQAVAIMDQLSTSWYGLVFASSAISDSDHLAIAGYVQGSANPHVYGVTTGEAGALDPASITDIAYLLFNGTFTRTVCQYSQNPYAVASFLGRAFTVNFNGNNTTLTMMYKIEPSIAAENLSLTQAQALKAKRCNVYVQYNNATSIIQYGTMSGPAFFDEIFGLDWLANGIQTALFNALFTTPTKIPQTDSGVAVLTGVVEAVCSQAVSNGLVAPGIWNSAGFGILKQGDPLNTGYYVYAPPISLQAVADREARKSPAITVAVKLAGAIHTVDCVINVNR